MCKWMVVIEAKEDFQDFHDGILQIFSRFDLYRGPNLTVRFPTKQEDRSILF